MLTNICEQKCGKCGYHTEYDGSEDFLLRKCWFKSQLHGSYEICFHWELLHETILQLVEGVHWYSTWVRQMAAYKRTGTSEVELMALQSVYKHFREACMDFECLWGLDYQEVLHCQCTRPGSTRVADGIMVSCKAALMCMYAPFLPKQPPAGEERVPQQHGSLYELRFAIPHKKVRELLVQASSVDGIMATAFEVLGTWCEHLGLTALAEALVAIQEPNQVQPLMPGWCRPLLRELGAESAACAIVPPAADTLVQEWVSIVEQVLACEEWVARREAGKQWTLQLKEEARDCLPVLFPTMWELHSIAVLGGRGTITSKHVGGLLHMFTLLQQVRMSRYASCCTFGGALKSTLTCYKPNQRYKGT
jgi:hypothetical protein